MSSPKPKQLRKRLRKAEAKLAKAEAKRDHAQARVEALAIIADEIRAQLEESEKATTDARPQRRQALLLAPAQGHDGLCRGRRRPAQADAPLRAAVRLCGWTLARANACSGDPAVIAGYLGSSDVFDRAIGDFAVAYADQNERYFAAFTDAIRDGRIPAHV